MHTHLVLQGREPSGKLLLQTLQCKVNQAVVQELRHLKPVTGQRVLVKQAVPCDS